MKTSPQPLIIGGRRYVVIAEAARLAHYTDRQIAWLVRNKPHLIRHHRPNHRVYVCLSDVLKYASCVRKNTKLQQIMDWWNRHVQQRSEISDTYDFHRRLLRDGISCSPSLARTFLAKYRPRVPDSCKVLAWLEEDPTRRHLSATQTRLALLTQLRLDVHSKSVKRAWKRFDARHGALQPPFDTALYMSTKDAAERYGISRSLITQYVAQGKLATGIHWKDTLYIPRSSLDKVFGQDWVKKGETSRQLREWFHVDLSRLHLTATVIARTFTEASGIPVTQALVYRIRREITQAEQHVATVETLNLPQEHVRGESKCSANLSTW